MCFLVLVPAVLLFASLTRAQEVPISTSGRIAKLRSQIAEQRIAAKRATERYHSKLQGNITDLACPAADILRQLPGVHSVQVFGSEKPAQRIIHILDWHFVPKPAFAADIRDQSAEAVSDEEIDRLYAEHLLEVELVQLEQAALLQCLIKHHGLRQVFCEGLTVTDMPIYRRKIAALRKAGEELAELRREYELLGQELTALTDAKEIQEANSLRQRIGAVLVPDDLELLKIGTAGKLLLSSELKEVLPLDDAELLAKANPVRENGRVDLDRSAIEARQDGKVQLMLKAGPVGVAILGGGHDLSDNIDRLSNGTCEYVRVTTESHKKFAGASTGR